LDMYKKVPIDLMEGTKRGSYLSWIALLVMMTLFVYETNEYWKSKLIKDLRLDRDDHTNHSKIRLNFNITMLDLRCDWAVVDVVSVLGTDQNVTAEVKKFNLDASGAKQAYKGRNRDQKDIDHYDKTVTETIEELYEDGEHAMNLNGEEMAWAKDNFDFLFVDFFASWCSHCQKLAPTWEALAELMADHHYDNNDDDDVEQPDEAKTAEDHMEGDLDDSHFQQVQIAKVDCVQHNSLCNEYDVRSYPTLRLFIDGQPWKELFKDDKGNKLKNIGNSDYEGHRTVLEMVEWLHHIEQQIEKDESAHTLHLAHEAARDRLDDDEKDDEDKKWNDPAIQKKKKLHHKVGTNWKDSEHPGCQITGHLLLDRAPGNFHVLARSNHHDLVPEMTNVSHLVNELYIGDPTAMHWINKKRSLVPTEVESTIMPLNGNAYRTLDLHQSYHHYIKLIATKVDGMKVGSKELVFYQMLANSQLAFYDDTVIPEAKFAYDLSPIAVKYSFRSRKWYAYLTSIFAIIGGVFTVVGMIEGVLGRIGQKVGRNRSSRPR